MMGVKITHLDHAKFVIQSRRTRFSASSRQNSAGRERKANTRKAVIPYRPIKPIFIVLCRSEINEFDPASIAVPWTVKPFRSADKSLFMNSLYDHWLMQILPLDAPGKPPH
jgi:hypothetical protein